eukprot:3451836-Amphidinium_carterae.2
MQLRVLEDLPTLAGLLCTEESPALIEFVLEVIEGCDMTVLHWSMEGQQNSRSDVTGTALRRLVERPYKTVIHFDLLLKLLLTKLRTMSQLLPLGGQVLVPQLRHLLQPFLTSGRDGVCQIIHAVACRCQSIGYTLEAHSISVNQDLEASCLCLARVAEREAGGHFLGGWLLPRCNTSMTSHCEELWLMLFPIPADATGAVDVIKAAKDC